MPTASDVTILDQRCPEERSRPFLPGMGRAWLLPLYDVFTGLAGVRALHERAVEIAGVAPGEAVLDVGCGTGNLSFAVLAAQPDARITGLDPDGTALRWAARKARRRGVPLVLVQGYADRLPAEDASLDHVISSLALHHVDDGLGSFAREAHRVLRPGGKITVVDFAGPAQDAEGGHRPPHGHGRTHTGRHLHGLIRSRVERSPALARALGDGIVALLAEAEFVGAREVGHVDHRFGRVTFVQATKGGDTVHDQT